MTDPVAILHPRKLHAMICACPSAKARADAAFEFLRSAAGSDAGYLLLMRDDELVIVARFENDEAPRDLVDEAARSWARQLEAQPDDQKTLDVREIQALRAAAQSPVWTSSSGESFERRMLSTYRGTRWVAVGMVFLEITEGRPLLPIRHAHVEALCGALIEAGDVPDRESRPGLI